MTQPHIQAAQAVQHGAPQAIAASPMPVAAQPLNLPIETGVDALAAQQLVQDHSVAGAALPVGKMSMWDLFWGADIVVQLVMLGLIAASLWSWTIIIHKTLRLKRLNHLAGRFEEAFWSGVSLDDLFARIQGKVADPMASIFCAAMTEWRRAFSRGGRDSSKAGLELRLERVMRTTLSKEVADLESHIGFLASLGTNAVIVGLFGTVLGIMNSFEAIAAMQNTNLAVVAPGIAEALFATAIGLVVAIPASIAFNSISTKIGYYETRLEHFVNEFSSIISRQLEETQAA